MFRAYLFFSAIIIAKAQIPNLGFCPDYLPMNDFDIESFLGKWYEAERYFQFSEVGSRCVVTDYAKGPNGKIYVSNEVTNRLTGIKRVIDGYMELTGRVGEGKLNVKYSTTPISTQASLTVLETDYDNYAVIWSCSGFGLVNAQSVWVMTRDRLPPANVLQKVYGVLDKFKISRSFFVKTDQKECALAASDINAANGITAQSTVAQPIGLPQRKVPLTLFGGDDKKSVQSSESVLSTNNNNVELAEASKSVDGHIELNEASKSKDDHSNLVEPSDSSSKVKPTKVQETEPQRDTANTDSVISEPISPEENSDSVNSEPINSEKNNDSVNTEPINYEENNDSVNREPIKSEENNSLAAKTEVVSTNTKSENIIDDKLSLPDISKSEATSMNPIKPTPVAELLLENNSVQQNNARNNQLKSDIRVGPTTLEGLALSSAPKEELLPLPQTPAEIYVPLKTSEEKVTVTETKTN